MGHQNNGMASNILIIDSINSQSCKNKIQSAINCSFPFIRTTIVPYSMLLKTLTNTIICLSAWRTIAHSLYRVTSFHYGISVVYTVKLCACKFDIENISVKREIVATCCHVNNCRAVVK